MSEGSQTPTDKHTLGANWDIPVVIAGSNGEAVATKLEERLELISLTRDLATKHGRGDMPIVIGTVGQATKDIIQQLGQANAAGADFALVLTPSYFHFAMSAAAIQAFFVEVKTDPLCPSY